MTFLYIIYQKKISLHPIFWKTFWTSGFSLKVPGGHDLLYDTAVLTYKIYILHFHFPVRRTSAYRNKTVYLSLHMIAWSACPLTLDVDSGQPGHAPPIIIEETVPLPAFQKFRVRFLKIFKT